MDRHAPSSWPSRASIFPPCTRPSGALVKPLLETTTVHLQTPSSWTTWRSWPRRARSRPPCSPPSPCGRPHPRRHARPTGLRPPGARAWAVGGATAWPPRPRDALRRGVLPSAPFFPGLQDIERLGSGLPALALDRINSGLGSMHMVRLVGALVGAVQWKECLHGAAAAPLPPRSCMPNPDRHLPCGPAQVAISPIGSPDHPDLASLASGPLSLHAVLAAGSAGATATVSLVTVPGAEAAAGDGFGK